MKTFPSKTAKLLACTVSLTALALTGTAPAFAQAAPAPDAKTASGVEEIVVTAQKREQRLQDVPVAVTAVSQNTLQVNRVTSVNDLTGLAPGLVSRQNAGSLASPSFAMRGVFASASAATQDREISMYLDGVYVGGNRGSAFDLPDLERIEVLRGPQGTLFGRNATAGAVSIITRDPIGVFSARQDFTVGNYGQFRSRTTFNTPQIGAFSGYFTYVHDEKRGDVRNLGAGVAFDRSNPLNNIGVTSSPKYLGSHDTNSVFAALKFAPNDDFKLVYKFDYSKSDNTPEARAINVVNPASFIGNLLNQVLAAQPAGGGPFGPIVFDPSNKRPDSTNNSWSQPGFAKSWGHNLTASLRLSDNISLKNIASYRYAAAYGPSTIGALDGLQFTQGALIPYATFAAVSQFGAAFGSFPAATQGAIIGAIANALQPNVGRYFASYVGNSTGVERQYSDELQANYQSRLLSVTIGGLYYHSKEVDDGLLDIAPNFAFAAVPQQLPLGNLQQKTGITESLAAYGQVEVHLTPQLDLVAGGRITRDKKTSVLLSGGTLSGTRTGGSIVGTSFSSFEFKKTKPTFSAGINYKPSRDILVYGKYSTAFLSGGSVGPLTFAPETAKSVEAGLKSEFFQHRLRANLALWTVHYAHSQSAQSGSVITDPNNPTQTLAQYGVVVIDNGPLHARGAEVELTAAPIDGVTFGGSLGYTHAKLTNPNPLATNGQPYKISGVAKWVGSVYGQYESKPLFDEATMLFRLDGNYQGKYRNITNPNIATVSPAFAPYEFTKARWILNGRVALHNMKWGRSTAEIGVWSRNLTNNKDALYTLQFGDFLINSSYQPARTFGVDLSVKFQ